MTEHTPNWGEFERRRTERLSAQPDTDLEVLCAQVFGSLPGRALQDALRARYVTRSFNAAVPEAILRVFTAEAQLVLALERMTENGLATLAARKDQPKT